MDGWVSGFTDLLEHGIANEKEIFLTGRSYGGYLLRTI